MFLNFPAGRKGYVTHNLQHSANNYKTRIVTAAYIYIYIYIWVMF